MSKMDEATKTRLKQKAKDLALLFLLFFKVGLFSFGGGYAMLTMFETEFVEKRNWLTHSELADIFAIAESTPGAIAINIATFIGTKRCGILGGILATLGVVVPSFCVILGLSYVIALVKDNFWVACLFKGVRVGVLVLIFRAVVTFFKDMKKNVYSFVLMAAGFAVAFFTDVSVIYVILGSIVLTSLGVAFLMVRNNRYYHMKGTDAYYSELVGPPAKLYDSAAKTADGVEQLDKGETVTADDVADNNAAEEEGDK